MNMQQSASLLFSDQSIDYSELPMSNELEGERFANYMQEYIDKHLVGYEHVYVDEIDSCYAGDCSGLIKSIMNTVMTVVLTEEKLLYKEHNSVEKLIKTMVEVKEKFPHLLPDTYEEIMAIIEFVHTESHRH